jgi:hypothetical protein
MPQRGRQEKTTMKRVLARALGFALLVSVAGCAASDAQTEVSASFSSPGSQVSVSYFYDNLSSDGEWVQEPSYGWCWTPYDMSADWRPYYDGHWEYTDYGWSWASNERWGWATYHYGRWLFDDSYGWVWVPGTEWAPAWVAWRYSDSYVGWAPLPPSAGWDVTAGLSFADANSIRSDDWCFVPQTHMLDVNIRVQVTSVARNVTLIGRSRDATRFEVRDGRPANVGVDVALVEKSVNRPVPRVKIVDVDAPARGNGREVGKGAVGYYRPKVQPATPDLAPPPAVTERRNTIPDVDVQRQRGQQQRKLDNDLKAEQARLARDQQNEMRGQSAGPAADEVRKRHDAEQQAFVAHAAQQRKVLDQRIQKKIVKPGKAKGNDKGQDKGQGTPPDQGQNQTQDKGQDQGQGKGGGKGNQ